MSPVMRLTRLAPRGDKNLCLALAVLAAVGLSCGTSPKPGPPYTPPAYAQVVTLALENGREIDATLMQPSSAVGPVVTPRGVIALHSWSGDRGELDVVLKPLVDAEFSVLLLDLRSVRRGSGPELERYLRRDVGYFIERITDIQTAKQYLAEVCGADVKRIALLGIGVGGSIALHAAAADRSTPALVLVSPGVNYLGLSVRAAATQLNTPRVLVVYAESATGEPEAAAQLCSWFPKAVQAQTVPLVGRFEDSHGGAALRRADVEARIIEFIKQSVR